MMSWKSAIFAFLTIASAIPEMSYAQTSPQLLDCIRYVSGDESGDATLTAATACQDVTDLTCVRYIAGDAGDVATKAAAATDCKAPLIMACPSVVTQVVDIECIKLVTNERMNSVDLGKAAAACRRTDIQEK